MVANRSVDASNLITEHRSKWPLKSFLAQLPDNVIDDFIKRGDVVRFHREDKLMKEGEVGIHVFLLLSALVKVTADLGQDRRALLSIRVGGDVVGEIAVMDGGCRSASVRACGDDAVVAVRLDRDDFLALLNRHSCAATSLVTEVARKLRAATRRRVDYVGCTARVRLARVLVELAEDYGVPGPVRGLIIPVNLTRLEWATLVGATEPKTARLALGALRRDGLIDDRGRRVTVLDLKSLRDIAGLNGIAHPVV